MKLVFKPFWLLALLATLALIATACGGAAPAATSTSAPAAAATNTSAPAAAATNTTAPAGATATTAPAGATATTAPTGGGGGGGTLNVAFYQEPNALIGYYSSQTFTYWVMEMSNPGFWTWDDKAAPTLELADVYPAKDNGGISADGLTYTYKLKKGLKWSDGQPFTAKDVAFTWKSIMNDKNTGVTSRDGYDKIDSVTASDDTTAVVKFKEFYAPWYTLFNFNGFLPEHVLGTKATLDSDPYLRAPLSMGAFKVTEFKGGDHITLVANENYWRGKPKLDGINIKITPSRDAGNAGLAAGDIDIVADEIEAAIPDLDALAPKAKASAVPSQNFEHYFFNMGTKANGGIEGPVFFKDEVVRKAYGMCIDRETIAKRLLFGKTKIIADLWPNSEWENTDLKPYAFDPAAANKMLDDAGWKKGDDGVRAKTINGQVVKIAFNHETTTGNQLRADVQVFSTSTLGGCGMQMLPQNYPSGTLFGTFAQNGPLATGNYQTGGYTTAYTPDPDPGDNFKCSGIPTKEHPDGNNWYRLCDPDLEKLSIDQSKETDPVKRKDILKQMQKLMYDKAYNLPMYNRLNVIGLSARVKGVRQSPTQGDAYWNIYEISVQ